MTSNNRVKSSLSGEQTALKPAEVTATIEITPDELGCSEGNKNLYAEHPDVLAAEASERLENSDEPNQDDSDNESELLETTRFNPHDKGSVAATVTNVRSLIAAAKARKGSGVHTAVSYDDFISQDDYIANDNLAQLSTATAIDGTIPFSPFQAVAIANGQIEINMPLLRENLEWEPNIDYKKSSSWKPTKIKPFNLAKVLNFDIETTGLDPLGTVEGYPDLPVRVIMVGFKINGPFNHLAPDLKKELEDGFILYLEDYTDDAEKDILRRTFDMLKFLNHEIISAHFGLGFDFPFLYARAKHLKVPCPIDIDRERLRYVTSSEDGRGEPVSYFPTWFSRRNANGYFSDTKNCAQILDTIIAAAIDNKIRRNYKSFSLKRLVTDHFKIRTEKRLEIAHHLIAEYWLSGDPKKRDLLTTYLLEDLQDQEYVTDIYGPLIWGQQAFFPLSFQDLLLGSPARKWNSLYRQFYKRHYGQLLPDGPVYRDEVRAIAEGKQRNVKPFYKQPESSDTYRFVGGEVDCKTSLKRYFAKIDVASLYPSLMLRYMLVDIQKDPLCVGLKVLEVARDFRYVLKPLGNGEKDKAIQQPAYIADPEMFEPYLNATKQSAKGSDAAMKVAINGYYGFLGTGGYDFNMPVLAALVTGYGRVIMEIMKETVFALSEMINLDTDGVTFSPFRMLDVNPDFPWDQIGEMYTSKGKLIEKTIDVFGEIYVNAEWIYAYTQSRLPQGLAIELETHYPAGLIYSYKAKNYAYWKHDSGVMGVLENCCKGLAKTYTEKGISLLVTPLEESKVPSELLTNIGEFQTEDDDGNDIDILPIVEGFLNIDYLCAYMQTELPEWVDIDVTERGSAYEITYHIDASISIEEMRETFKPKDFNVVKTADSMGLFNKRNLSRLRKEFTLEYARRLGFYGEECADEYYTHIREYLRNICSQDLIDCIENFRKEILVDHYDLDSHDRVAILEKFFEDILEISKKNFVNTPDVTDIPLIETEDDTIEKTIDKFCKDIYKLTAKVLTHEELDYINIKRKISKTEKKIVEFGVGLNSQMCNYYFGSFLEIGASGKALKMGQRQPFFVRVAEGEWGELSANPPRQDEIADFLNIERNDIDMRPSFEIYDAILTELRDEAHMVATGRATTAELIADEKNAKSVAKLSIKNDKRIAAMMAAEKPYKQLLKEVWSGGQSGGDQAGLYAARDAEIDTGGICPNGFLAYDESGTIRPCLKLKEFGLKEHRSEKFPPRTRENVKKTDGTVWFGTTDSGGFTTTFEAIAKHSKPWIINPSAEDLADFIKIHWIEILNVAGNREDPKYPGIFESTYEVCRKAFDRVKGLEFDPDNIPDRSFDVYVIGQEESEVKGAIALVPTVPKKLQ
jgi:DNA polymerase, archaea type